MSQITKNAISSVFSHILSEKPLSKITVKEITEKCGINRMTFYYHFEDIYDLADWTVIETAKKAVDGIPCCGDSWQEWYIALGHSALEHKTFLHNLISAMHYEQIVLYLYDLTYPILMSAIDQQDPENQISPENKRLLADFLKCAFVGIELEWVRNGMTESPEVLTHRLHAMIHGQIAFALSNLKHCPADL